MSPVRDSTLQTEHRLIIHCRQTHPQQLGQRDKNAQVCDEQNKSIGTNVKAGRRLLFNIGRRHWNDSNLFFSFSFIYPGLICWAWCLPSCSCYAQHTQLSQSYAVYKGGHSFWVSVMKCQNPAFYRLDSRDWMQKDSQWIAVNFEKGHWVHKKKKLVWK